MVDKQQGKPVKINEPSLEDRASDSVTSKVVRIKKENPLYLIKIVQGELNREDPTVERVRGEYDKPHPLDEYTR